MASLHHVKRRPNGEWWSASAPTDVQRARRAGGLRHTSSGAGSTTRPTATARSRGAASAWRHATTARSAAIRLLRPGDPATPRHRGRSWAGGLPPTPAAARALCPLKEIPSPRLTPPAGRGRRGVRRAKLRGRRLAQGTARRTGLRPRAPIRQGEPPPAKPARAQGGGPRASPRRGPRQPKARRPKAPEVRTAEARQPDAAPRRRPAGHQGAPGRPGADAPSADAKAAKAGAVAKRAGERRQPAGDTAPGAIPQGGEGSEHPPRKLENLTPVSQRGLSPDAWTPHTTAARRVRGAEEGFQGTTTT